MIDITIKVWWESNDINNAAFLVTSGLDESHPLQGCWNNEQELIEAGRKLGFNVTVEEV